MSRLCKLPLEHRSGKVAQVASASPDTGQRVVGRASDLP